MTAIGAMIVATMGSVCMIAAGTGAAWATVPIALGAGMVWLTLMGAATFLNRRTPKATAAEQARVNRLVMWASAGEGVAILVGINVVNNIGHADWVAPVIALVVGLHFVPLALWLPAPAYWLTALALVAVAAAGLSIAPEWRKLMVFAASATVLWLTSAGVMWRVNARLD